jgi:hypothetical protein
MVLQPGSLATPPINQNDTYRQTFIADVDGSRETADNQDTWL